MSKVIPFFHFHVHFFEIPKEVISLIVSFMDGASVLCFKFSSKFLSSVLVIIYKEENKKFIKKVDFIEAAVETGSLRMVVWGIENNIRFDKLCRFATSAGQLQILKYAHENG